jgi:CelD/BcsL family acetyltransferase involved in cellulose biosynthesis
MSPQFLVLKGPKAISRVFPQWEGLLVACADGAEGPDFFLGSDWLAPWLGQYAGRGEVYLAVLKQDEQWLAGLPMQITRGSYGKASANRLSIAGFPESDCTFIPAVTQQYRQLFVDRLIQWWLAELPRVLCLDFRELPENGETLAALRTSTAQSSDQLHVQTVAQSPRYLLQSFEQADNQITGKLGRNLRRRMRILSEAGQVDFQFECIEPSQVDPILQTCAQIEAKSWKGKEQVGALSAANRPFVQRVWQRVAEQGGLAVATLALDGGTIAYHWGMLRGGIFLSYNLAHLPDTHKLSPGTVLLQHMIENAAQLGIREMDASRGGLDHDHILAPYKGPVRMHARAILFRRSVLGRLLSWRMQRQQAENQAK